MAIKSDALLIESLSASSARHGREGGERAEGKASDDLRTDCNYTLAVNRRRTFVLSCSIFFENHSHRCRNLENLRRNGGRVYEAISREESERHDAILLFKSAGCYSVFKALKPCIVPTRFALLPLPPSNTYRRLGVVCRQSVVDNIVVAFFTFRFGPLVWRRRSLGMFGNNRR